MEGLLARCAAIVCVVVGSMFMGGAGAVAFATTGPDGGDNGSGSSGGTQSTPTSSTGGGHLPNLSTVLGLPNSALGGFTGGSIAPTTNLPPWLVPISSLPNLGILPDSGTPGLTAPSLAPFTIGAPSPTVQVPGVQQPNTTRPVNVATVDPDNQPPPTSLVPVVPSSVPDAQPVTTDSPPAKKPAFDVNKPIAPQLLPAPVVVILMAVAQRFPLAGLVINPILNATLPPFLADLVTPALLADIVVPTSSLGAAAPDTTTALANVASLSKPASVALPTELGVTGVDAPQAPEITPAPTVEPQSTSPSNNDITATSDPVAFRAGYSDYLRNAGMAQVTAIAVPGAAAILLFTLGGGFIGYRQARAGHVIRAEGISRFLR